MISIRQCCRLASGRVTHGLFLLGRFLQQFQVHCGDVPHVIASNDGLFKSKALDTDDKYSYTFSKAGTYSYYCSVHPKMVGKIVVQ